MIEVKYDLEPHEMSDEDLREEGKQIADLIPALRRRRDQLKAELNRRR